MHLLDTDIATLLLYGRNDRLNRRYEEQSQSRQIALPIVTRVQILKGRFDSLLKASDERSLLIAAQNIASAEHWFSQFEIVDISANAARKFTELRSSSKYRKIGIADFLIASISLVSRATLVTRNTKDFSLIPGIKLENWADD